MKNISLTHLCPTFGLVFGTSEGGLFFGQRAQKIPQLFQGGFQKSERALEHVFFGHFPNFRSKFEQKMIFWATNQHV